MDRSCSEDAEYNDCKSGSILDARWEKKGDPGQRQHSVEVKG